MVLGPTGRNFAAGMSGGIAYVLDEDGDFPVRCNQDMSDLESLADQEPEEIEEVRRLIQRHTSYTASTLALEILEDWEQKVARFVKVMPRDYKRVLDALRSAHADGLEGDEAWLQAFRQSIGSEDAVLAK